MPASDWIKLVVSIVACELAGVLGALATVANLPGWFATVRKPVFMPPNRLFGPVWTILYLLMGVAAFLVWRHGWQDPRVRLALSVFLVQLLLNAAWSPVFFSLHSIGGAMVIILLLWLAIVATIVLFSQINGLAGALLIPYILWVSFASVLNGAIWYLNRNP